MSNILAEEFSNIFGSLHGRPGNASLHSKFMSCSRRLENCFNVSTRYVIGQLVGTSSIINFITTKPSQLFLYACIL